MLMMIMIMLFNFMAMSSKNIISMWYFMEISSFIFIYHMIKMNNPPNSSIVYFMMSFFTSLMIFSAIMMLNEDSSLMNLQINNMNKSVMLFMMAFTLKMGAIPLHSWTYKMMMNMKMKSIMILVTLQKMIPIWFFSMMDSNEFIITIMIISITIFFWLPLLTKNTYIFLATSSIINNMWILMATMISVYTLILYTMTYFLININFIMNVEKTNSKFMIMKNPINSLMSTISLMGFPPTPNFFIKMMMIKNLFFNNNHIIYMMLMILIMNMISSMMYMKFILSSMLTLKNMKNWKNLYINKNMMNIAISYSPLIYMISMMKL